MTVIKISDLGNNAVKCKCIKPREALPEYGGEPNKDYILDKGSIVTICETENYGDIYEAVEGTDEIRFIGTFDVSRFKQLE